MHGSSTRIARALLIGATLVVAGCVLALIVFAIAGADTYQFARVAIPAVVAGAVAVVGWSRDRDRVAGAERAAADAQAEAERRIAAAQQQAAEREQAALAEAERQIAAAREQAAEREQAARAEADRRVAEAEAEADRRVTEVEAEAAAARAEGEQLAAEARAEGEERAAQAWGEAEREMAAAREDAQQRELTAQEEAASQIEAAREEADRRIEAARRETEEARSEAGREREEAERRLQTERRSRDVVERARRAERQWAEELRSQVASLHRERGALSNPDDITGLVLQTAMSLIDADKGLLLRRDGDGDGSRLRVARHLGFEHDPDESALARSFAERVLKRDETIRENDEDALDAASRTPADDEIDNIVAIPIYVRDEFGGAVVLANKSGGFDEYEDEVLLALGDHAGSVLDNARLRAELRSSYLATVQMLGDAIAAKDPFLGGHSREVSGYVGAVAERLGVDPRRREELIFGSLLHDIGKIGISERILLKPARLTPEERAIIELHPRIGYRLVSRIPALEPIAAGVLHHHERFDGGGYPARLRGEQIPLEARIISVADSFSAMTQDRPYRARMSLEDACLELERCAGTQFDPEVVRVFVEEVRRGPAPWPEDDRGDLGEALGDAELAVHRSDGEPLLGSGTLAIIDNLTLLYSHRYLHEAAAAEAQRAEVQGVPFALAIVELTALAGVNEREGHAAGDAVIQSAARAVQRAASRCAGTACRYSGDRLALLMPSTDGAGAEACLRAMLGDWPSSIPVRHGLAVWQPGQRGADVVAAARAALGRLPLPADPPAVP
jgi:HD-GYP domain-containing protein (c-di-GMP phosphodiesterase class II)